MQPLLLLLDLEIDAALDAVRPPGGPLRQNFPHAHDPGHTGDEDIEVAGEAVLQGGHTEKLLHQLLRVHAPLQVDGQLQAPQVRLVPHIGDLPDLSGLDELRHLVHNDLGSGGIGNFRDFDQVPFLDIAPLGPEAEAAPAGGIDLPGGRLVKQQLAAGGEIRPRQSLQNVMIRIFHQGDGGIADLFQIEGANVAGHAHGDALIGRHQHIGEGGGKQAGLLHGGIVVVHHVHSVGVDVPE